MGMFYKVSNKQSLKDRNNLFMEVGIPSLEINGFKRAPFKSSWNGEYNKSIKGYSYQISRVRENKYLETLDIYVLNEESGIQIYLNIFELFPELVSILDLINYEGLGFTDLVNQKNKMRLRSVDDYKGPPIFYMLFLPQHKIGSYYTKSGYEAELSKLKKLIKSDMGGIDDFVKRWHELHKPNLTDWEGNIIT